MWMLYLVLATGVVTEYEVENGVVYEGSAQVGTVVVELDGIHVTVGAETMVLRAGRAMRSDGALLLDQAAFDEERDRRRWRGYYMFAIGFALSWLLWWCARRRSTML